jgi:hypothetical protein
MFAHPLVDLIIGDHTPMEHRDLNAGMKGLIPRAEQQPVGYSAIIPPAQFKTYTYDEMVARIADMERAKSRISDILLRGDAGKPIPSLDQNGQGFCWMYGPVGAVQAKRAIMKLPYKQLSAHAAACKVKNYKDEGGWGAQGMEFLMTNGVPDTEHWAEKSMSRSFDTPATWANAKLYMPDVVLADIASPVYNRDLSYAQQLTALIDLNPTVDDYDHWGHCVFGCDAVNGANQRAVTRLETGKLPSLEMFDLMWGMNDPVTRGLAKRFRNSWFNYGDRGFAVLAGAKAVGSNSVALVNAIA